MEAEGVVTRAAAKLQAKEHPRGSANSDERRRRRERREQRPRRRRWAGGRVCGGPARGGRTQLSPVHGDGRGPARQESGVVAPAAVTLPGAGVRDSEEPGLDPDLKCVLPSPLA